LFELLEDFPTAVMSSTYSRTPQQICNSWWVCPTVVLCKILI